jgi:hypothetical protein
MVARCLADSTPFGVTWIRTGREVGPSDLAVAGVGTMAEIRDATVLPDGRYDLVAVGTRRFRIGSVTTDAAPYLVAEVEPLEEVIDDESRARRLTRVVTRRFIRYVERVRELTSDDVAAETDPDRAVGSAAVAEMTELGPDVDPADASAGGSDADEVAGGSGALLAIPADPTLLSHLLSGIVELDLPRRQGLLERETTDDRLDELATILARETAYLGGRLRVFLPDPRSEAAARN